MENVEDEVGKADTHSNLQTGQREGKRRGCAVLEDVLRCWGAFRHGLSPSTHSWLHWMTQALANAQQRRGGLSLPPCADPPAHPHRTSGPAHLEHCRRTQPPPQWSLQTSPTHSPCGGCRRADRRAERRCPPSAHRLPADFLSGPRPRCSLSVLCPLPLLLSLSFWR